MRSTALLCLSVLLGTPLVYSTPQFERALSYGSGSSIQAISSADFNGDGFPDLVTATAGSITVLLNRGDGTFGAPLRTNSAGTDGTAKPAALAVADLNRDGIPDLIVAEADGGLEILAGKGDGTFSLLQTIASGTHPSAIAVGEWNNDGHVDLIIADRAGNHLVLIPGKLGGLFGEPRTIGYANAPTGLRLADFDGDGVMDLAVAQFGSNQIGIFLGSRDGAFRESERYSTGNGPEAIVSGDFNRDGLTDLAVLNTLDRSITVLLGASDGMFHAGAAVPLPASAGALSIADLDGDGAADLIVTDIAGGSVRIFQGVGDGSFGEGSILAAGPSSRSIVIADLNRDGLSDLAVGDGGGSAYVLLSEKIAPVKLQAHVIPSTTFVLGTPNITLGTTAGTSSVVLSVQPSTGAWTATANNSWLHTTASGTGSANVVFTYDANAGAPARTGTITIGDQTLTVTQVGTSWAAGLAGLYQVLVQTTASSGAAYDSADNIYATDGATVRERLASTGIVSTIISTGLTSPAGLAVDSQGNLYIADTASTGVRKWTASTQILSTVGSGLSSPRGVAVDAAGNLYIADTGNNQIQMWTSSTQQMSTLVTGLNAPRAVAVDAAGNVYIADSGNAAVKVWNAATQQVSTLIGTGLTTPQSIAVDGLGNVYVGDVTKAVEWNASTQATANFVGGYTNGISGLAIDPAGSSATIVDFADKTVREYPIGWIGPSLSEPATAGTDIMYLLPAGISQIGGIFHGTGATWISITSATNGVIHFSFTANTGPARTGAVNGLGRNVTVLQAAPPPGAATTITKTAGDARSTFITTNFATALQVTVTDASNIPEPGLSVTFTPVAGASGASGSFGASATVTTDANGVATAPALTANATAGAFTVTATVASLSTTFNLTNNPATYTLGTSSVYLASTAGTGTVSFAALPANSTTWTATANSPWLHTTASGTGPALVLFTFDANPGAARSGTLTIGGQTLTVLQAQSGSIPVLGPTSVISSALGLLEGMALDSQGNLYIADAGDHALQKWSPITKTFTPLIASGLNIINVALDAAGNVYIAGGTLMKWTAATQALTTLYSPPTGFIWGVAVDSSGNVYFSDRNLNTLNVWNASTQQVTVLVSSGLSGPEGIALDPSGNVYIADVTTKTIKLYTAATQQLSTVISTGLTNLSTLAIDGAGRLYIADSAIKLWDPLNPTQLVSLTTDGYALGVAVDPQGSSVYYANPSTGLKVFSIGTVPGSVTEPASGGADSVQVTPAPFATSASSDQSWLTVTGSSAGLVSFTSAVNVLTSTRTAHLTVNAAQVTVTQSAGQASDPVLLVKTAGDNQSTATNAAFATALKVTVTDTYGNLVPGASVTFAPVAGGSGANGVFSGSATVTTDSNGVATAPTLTGNSTGGTFTVTATCNALVLTFNETLVAPIFTLGSPSGSVGPTAGTASVFLAATPATAPWTVTSNTSWLHVSAGSAAGTGTAVVLYTYDANALNTLRTGTLTVAGQIFTVSQAGANWLSAVRSTVILNNPAGYAVAITRDPAGNIYFTDGIANTVNVWSAATQQISVLIPASAGLSNPGGIAIDPQGNLYIADFSNNSVKKWTAATQQLTSLFDGFYYPGGIALDPAGNVYVAGYFGVYSWSPVTQQFTALVTSGLSNFPNGLTLDAAGNVYISDYDNKAIKKWDAVTHQVSTVVSGTPDSTQGVAVDGFGNVYYSTFNALHVLSAVTHLVTDITRVNTGFNGLYADPRGGGVFVSDPSYNGGSLFVVETAWVGPPTLSEPATSGADAVQILPAIAYAGAASDQTWLTSTGNSNGVVGLSYAANGLISTRSANLSVAGSTVAVTQAAGVAGPPALMVNTAGDNQNTGQSSTFATALKVTVKDASGNVLSGVSVTFTPVPGGSGASGTFSGSSTVTTNASGIATAPTLTANGTAGAFTVTATSGAASTSFSETITVVTYTLGSPQVTVAPTTGSAQVMVMVSPTTGTWNASSNASWLHVTTASGTGNGRVPFTIDANAASDARTGTLTISGQTFNVTQAGTSYVASVSTPIAILTSGFTAPTGMAMDSQGNVYISDGTAKTLKKWTAATNTVTTLVSLGLTAPAGIALDSSGNVYIADTTAKAIFKWNGTALSTVVSSLTGPNAVAVDSTGKIYIADASILKLWNGTAISNVVSSGLSTPKGLAFDAAGALYIADTGNNAIKKWTSGTTASTVISGTTNSKGPIGIAADGLGNIYYTDTNGPSVKKWNLNSSSVVGNFSGLTTPKGIAVDPAGSNVYVANSVTASPVVDFEFAWISPGSFTEPAAGATDSALVIPSSVYTNPTSDQSWLTAPTSYSGNFNFTVAANIGVTRTAHVSVLGQSLAVTQVAGPPGAVANVVKTVGDSQTGAISATFLTPLTVLVTDASSIPEPGVSVLFTAVGGGSGASASFAGSATATATTDSNGLATAPALTANGTAGTFTLTAVSGAASATFNLTSIQPTFTLGVGTMAVAPTAGTGYVNIFVTPSNGVWTPVSDSGWLHAAASGSGSPLPFTFDANTSNAPRTGTLTLGSRNFVVTQAGATDLAANSQSTLVSTGLKGTAGVALDSAGNIYFTDPGSGTGHRAIKKLTPAGVASTPVATGLTGPWGVTVDPVGNLYIAEPTSIKKWTASTGVVSTVISGLNSPEWVALDSSGNIYTTVAGALLKWNGTATTTLISNIVSSQGVVVDGFGNVFVVDSGSSINNGSILEWNAATQQVTTLVSNLQEPGGLALDNSGNLYFSSFGAPAIQTWNLYTHQLTTLQSGSGVGGPLGIAVDATGNTVYFSDSTNNALKKITSAFIGPAALTETPASGADTAHVLPSTVTFTAVSDQTWLTVNTQASGAIGFSFTANATGAARTAHVTALGQAITVTQSPAATPAITWPAPADISYGAALSATQLNATTAGIPGTFAYSPPTTTVLSAGSGQTLSVTFTPTDTVSYATATATTTINVSKATPSITWPTPAAVTLGTALSATQLNASTSVAGSFVYTPPIGTVLSTVGTQPLSAVFTPTDTANYNSITTPNSITVSAPPPAVVTGVASLTPNGTYAAGASVSIAVSWSLPVFVTGVPRLALNSGGTALYTSGSGSPTLVFTYVVNPGDSTARLDELTSGSLTLNGGAIADTYGTAANLALAVAPAGGALGTNSSVVIDGVSPVVVSWQVLFGNTSYELIGSARNRLPWQITGVRVVFSKTVTSGTAASLTGLSATALSGLGTNTLTWTITPVAQGAVGTNLAGTGNNALRDGAGNALAGGTGFGQNLKVLQGDVNDDGLVNASDQTLVTNATRQPYNIFYDVNGDGAVTAADVTVTRARIGTSLP